MFQKPDLFPQSNNETLINGFKEKISRVFKNYDDFQFHFYEQCKEETLNFMNLQQIFTNLEVEPSYPELFLIYYLS